MQSALINNGRDLHLQHGPIDLIIKISGIENSVLRARQRACERFQTILPELVTELTILRSQTGIHCEVSGKVAVRMWQATAKFARYNFITPMASVAGAVADEILQCIVAESAGLQQVSVNNGGDIALWLGNEQQCKVGVADPVSGRIMAKIELAARPQIHGVATSGTGGRSLSLGIADSVTVLAGSTAVADAAATLIANSVDLPGNLKIHRQMANEVDPNSDLGHQLVVTATKSLTPPEVEQALNAGLAVARKFQQRRLITAAYLVLHGKFATTDQPLVGTQLPVSIDRENGYA